MGKKIPFDQAEKFGLKNKNDSIYCGENPYGYRYNVNHPQIRKFYDAFKNKYGILIPSDDERRRFEYAIDKMLKRGERNE